MNKRILAMLLSIVMIVGMIPFKTHAAELRAHDFDHEISSYKEFLGSVMKNSKCPKSLLGRHNIKRAKNTTVPATCEVFGYIQHNYTCKNCKALFSWKEYQVAAGLAEHTPGELQVDEAPTCTEDGSGHKLCQVCEKRFDEIIESTGHVMVDNEVAATCTENGYRNKKCSVCQEESALKTPILSEGHKWEENIVAATCTADGYKNSKCSVCQEESALKTPILSEGHKWEENVVAATCTADGYKNSKCSVCQEESALKTPILSEGHKWEENVVAATCTADGYKNSKCSICQEESVLKTVIESDGHDFEDGVCTKCGEKSPFGTPDQTDEEEEESQQPGQTEKKCTNKLHYMLKRLGWPCVGCEEEDFACRNPLHKMLKKLGLFCMGCDKWETEDDNTEEPAPEETEDNTPEETEHECSEFKAVANKDGMSHAIVCADDDCKAFQKNEAHKWEDGVCADCGAESPFQATPKCEHPSGVSIDQEVHEATCEEDGYILTVKVCDACGEEFEVRSELGEATGHDWEDGVCTNCGEESPFQTAPKNCKHPSGVSIAQKIVEPTCEEDGHILTKQICNDCGEEFERKDPLGKKAIGHDWKQTVTEATCTTDRKEEYECNNCGDTYEHVYTGSATGHTYVNGKCACGDVEAAEEIAPHKHSGAAVGQKVYEATCEKDGYILTKKVCDTCGETFEVKSPLGNAIGHNWKQTITPATCDEDGNEHYECTNCGDYYDVAIKANGHTYVDGKCACGAAQNSGSSNDKINFWNKYDVHFVGGSAY